MKYYKPIHLRAHSFYYKHLGKYFYNEKKQRPKVIGIGLNRTGSSSLGLDPILPEHLPSLVENYNKHTREVTTYFANTDKLKHTTQIKKR